MKTHCCWFLALCMIGFCPIAIVRAQQLEWLHQIATSYLDECLDISADVQSNVYVTGRIWDVSNPNLGGFGDAFVSKYDTLGNLLWTRQLGTNNKDEGHGISADSMGNVYITGFTNGSLSGPNVGWEDVFVAKYDASGNLKWIRQLGTSGYDVSTDVFADAFGSVYVAGSTWGNLGRPNAGFDDAFLCKYDASGNLQWTSQFGTSGMDVSTGVTADNFGNVFISGSSAGPSGAIGNNTDVAFVCKYDASGNLQWTRELGTIESDRSSAVSADAFGNVIISGSTGGDLGGQNAGGVSDAFVSKFNSSGNLQWTRQLGTAGADGCSGVSTDLVGDVYITGNTTGSLGALNVGAYGFSDAFVSKLDAAGNLLWTRQWGTPGSDVSVGVSAGAPGVVYIVGSTCGVPGALNADAFIAKFSAIPEPGTLLLGVVAGVACLLPRRR